MTANAQSFAIRPAAERDIAALCELLNEIIRIGGTTAIEAPLSHRAFGDCFLGGESHIACLAAVDGKGSALGFQALAHHCELPADWGDIATFARAKPKIPGVGSALFRETAALAGNHGLAAINATIRGDNTAGLAYYTKMGFQTYAVKAGVPLSDGTPVDRISKKYLIG